MGCCRAAWALGTRCALEASMCLYGQQRLTIRQRCGEAQLGWICKPNKGDFLRGAMRCSRKSNRELRAAAGRFRDAGTGLIARDGCPVFIGGSESRPRDQRLPPRRS